MMSLNIEQSKLVQARPGSHNLIKGVAGSGKTTVALHRLLFLSKNYCFGEEERILLVTYNRTLINYIKFLYEKISEEDKSLYPNIFSIDYQGKVDIVTIDKIIYDLYKKTEKSKQLQVNFDKNISYTLLNQAISKLKKKYPSVKILDQKNMLFLLDEIDWIKSCHYLTLEEYQHIDRLGRMSYQSSDAPQKLIKNSPVRQALFELMLLYNQELAAKGLISIKDAAATALIEIKKINPKKYNHIIVDESQDLTRVQLELIKLLHVPGENSSVTFIVDTAQSIYPHSWLVKGRSFTTIGFDMTGKSNSLTKNYRTTTQIAQAAYSLIENDANIIDDENFVKPYLIDRQGSYPVYKYFKNFQSEAVYVMKEIQALTNSGYNLKDIVIISRTKIQLQNIQEHLDQANLSCHIVNKNKPEFDSEGVKLMTMHSVKGLEFKVVFIIGINKNLLPYFSYTEAGEQHHQESQERKLFYVGMTRANELLFLSSSSFPSKFIKEINPLYLKLSLNSKIKKFYRIKLSDYLLTENIFDLYSHEEKIRQWMLKELINTYKYPQNMLEVEYKVNEFSRVGLVDIAVSIYRNNNLSPFILVETKAWGEEISSGLNQLKSYMSNCKTCRYGIVTNGNDFLVLDAEFNHIDDIPPFHSSMLPSSLQTYNYIDLKSSRKVQLIKDTEVPHHLEVTSDSESTERVTCQQEKLLALPVFEDVAAGLPLYMTEKATEKFSLPQEWFNRNKEVFILKVRGDSMVEANIEDGNYVVVEKQQIAQNRDIVVVALGEDATLKRFLKMGDTVLLTPENKKYEPIQVKDEQAKVLGIVTAIIKKM